MYPVDLFAGNSKDTTHDYTGVTTAEDEYWNGTDWNEIGGSTGHLVAIETELGTYLSGTHANARERFEWVEARLNTTVMPLSFYLAGQIADGSQYISGISLGDRGLTLSCMMVNLRTAPVGAIGGHFDVWDGPDASGAKILSVHINAGDLGGQATGASGLPSGKPFWIHSPTGSTMGDANITVLFEP